MTQRSFGSETIHQQESFNFAELPKLGHFDMVCADFDRNVLTPWEGPFPQSHLHRGAGAASAAEPADQPGRCNGRCDQAARKLPGIFQCSKHQQGQQQIGPGSRWGAKSLQCPPREAITKGKRTRRVCCPSEHILKFKHHATLPGECTVSETVLSSPGLVLNPTHNVRLCFFYNSDFHCRK